MKLLTALLIFPFLVHNDTAAPVEQEGLDIAEVSFSGLGPAARKLLDAREARKPEVILHFDSPGGDVRAMFVFAGLMKHVHLGGTRIICVVDGMAASAGFYLLEMCDYRVAYQGSTFLAHEVSTADVSGKPIDIEAAAKLCRVLTHVMSMGIAAHLKISLEAYEAKIKDQDWWFGANEALQVGAVDAIVPMGTYDAPRPARPDGL